MTELDGRILDRIAAENPDGLLGQVDGRWVLTMARFLAYPPERVWPWLVERDRLRRWSPVVPDGGDLGGVGPASTREFPEAEPSDAEVLTFVPHRELVHRWGDHYGWRELRERYEQRWNA